MTLATGEMSDSEADRAGLVPTHAYAMLDIREVKGVRLFMLKNPWSHLRWRGNYSELDSRHWTPEMQKALNYDPKCAKNFDNGVFWVSRKSNRQIIYSWGMHVRIQQTVLNEVKLPKFLAVWEEQG